MMFQYYFIFGALMQRWRLIFQNIQHFNRMAVLPSETDEAAWYHLNNYYKKHYTL